MDLGSILSLGASLFGGGGSGAAAPSSGGGLDWGSILAAIGKTAGSFKATPNEGASRKDIEKANRFNLLAGLLGSGAQIAGGVMSQQRKGEAYNALADILGGKATTTGQAITPSEIGAVGTTPTVTTQGPQSTAAQIMYLGRQYPELSKEFLDIGTTLQEREQKSYLEELKAAQRGAFSPQDRLARAQYFKATGEPTGAIPELISQEEANQEAARQAAIQTVQEKYGKVSGVSPALRGLAGPESIAAKPSVSIDSIGAKPSIVEQTSPLRSSQSVIDATQFPEEYRQQAIEAQTLLEGGKPPEMQPMRGEAPSVTPTPIQTAIPQQRQAVFPEENQVRQLEAERNSLINQKSELEGKPSKTVDEFRQLAQVDSKLKRVESQISPLQSKLGEQNRIVREERNKIAEPLIKVLQKGARANDLYDTILSQLNQGTRLGDELAVKTLVQSIDDSVVHPSEQQATLSSLMSKRDSLIRMAESYIGINKPFPPDVKDQIVSIANDVRDVSLRSRKRAEDAINQVAVRRAKGDPFASLSDYDQQYPTVKELLSGIGQTSVGIKGITTSPQSPLAGLSPIPTTGVAPTRRIVSIEPYNP